MSRDIQVVAAEILRDGRYLIAQRLGTGMLPDVWEFPGGRVHDGQTEEDALREALRARLGVDATVGERVLEVVHSHADHIVSLAVYRCTLGDQEPHAQRVAGLAWVLPDELVHYPFAPADQRAVDAMISDN